MIRNIGHQDDVLMAPNGSQAILIRRDEDGNIESGSVLVKNSDGWVERTVVVYNGGGGDDNDAV